MRKLVRVPIDPQVVSDMIRYGKERTVTHSIPETAQLVNASYNIQSACFELVYEDDSFDERKEGELIPVLMVTHTRIEGDN